MKKLLISMGLAVASTASLHAAVDASKVWSVSGTLRGFYDNNYTTGNNERGSFGFEVSPKIEISVPLQQTELGARYVYGLYYYQDREEIDQDPIDHTHQLDLWVDHAFTERWRARVQDTFVVAQEPELLSGDTPGSTVTRVEGNNIANTGTISLNTDWTRLFSTELSYQNKFYSYEDDEENAFDPSLAGLLDRLEHLASIDFQWHATPTALFLVGYQFGQVNYTADQAIAVVTVSPFIYNSSVRDSRSHYGYIGTQWAILPTLNLSAKVGAQYTDNYNDPLGNTSFGPYVDLSLTYTYLPGSYTQLGFKHTRNATDTLDPIASTGSVALDQESSLVYGSINHKITTKLLASLIGRFQNSTFNGGTFDTQSDDLYSVGVNLNYAFTRHFSSEVGYNYDHLNSDIPNRSYSRSRFYFGVTATY